MKTGLFFTGGTEDEPAVEWQGERIGDVSYPRNIGTVWPAEDLAAIGLARPLDADAVPGDKRSAGKAVLTVGGVPKWVHTLIDLPRDLVSAERDRRIEAGLTVNIDGTDRTFQFDAKSRENINGGATLAGFAMAAGAGPGNYLWHGGAQPFSWILADNSVIQLDAPTMFAVGQAAANRVSRFTFAARAIKDLGTIPADYNDDARWPA